MSCRPYWFRQAPKARARAWGWGVLIPLLAMVPTWAGVPARPYTGETHRAGAAAPANVTATAAILVDARSGQVLYGRNPHLSWPPASTTKIMTALVALEHAHLDTMIEITPEVAHFREGSVVGLPEGARISLHDLLYALLLPSGNDVALAVAEGVAGSVPAFVDLMNDRAQELGARQTHFTSPHGLYDRDHYTTAYDLALIADAAMQNPVFREVVHTRRWTFSVPGHRSRWLFNHNRLLSRYPGADGVKTGYVHQSGQTLVASATRNGWRLIAVLLHSRDEWGDAARLLTYGFAHYHSTEVASVGEPLAVAQLSPGGALLTGVVPRPVYAALLPGEVVRRQVSLDSHVALPIRRRARVGEVDFYVSGRLLRSAPLVAAEDVTNPMGLPGLMGWFGRVVWDLSAVSRL
ncbi:MAG TPA: D-alanyl-D-alanine carboxypeptidase family protein [bacterium]|nr:D-alanyl-D-alanine carboxypeptidase family protein [bacterium]